MPTGQSNSGAIFSLQMSSRFGLQSDSRQIHIWREAETRFKPSDIVERDQYGCGSTMMWAGIMITTRTSLQKVRVNGKV